ncbi:MAG TPA: fumarylacetoacetate hydrolase family protein [Chthonomonadaceae bacterium]|nr:fumarylacetoacetate hydrolase family protein [Chthonomonadaceae bacterium]
MALCRYTTYMSQVGWQRHWGWMAAERVYALDDQEVHRVLTTPPPEGLAALGTGVSPSDSLALTELDRTPDRNGHPCLIAPIMMGQEVWAAGVTYESSKLARMSESEAGGDFYAKVYTAQRPELFFKATPNRVVGPNDAVRIRADSAWNVPEPELAALIAASGQLLGYTIGNDMSSRDIEGENPLYLPQAKVYRASCALGPWIVPAEQVDAQNLAIRLTIARGDKNAFTGETSTARMRRTVAEIVPWLLRENDFPHGVLLLTGTGIVPPDDFTLQPGDQIAIEIEHLGTLRNVVSA